MQGKRKGPRIYSDEEINTILEQLDAYIVALGREKVPRTLVRHGALHDEIDELTQRVRIKLWRTLQSTRIKNLRAYTHCIFYTEVVDTVRSYHPSFPLPLDEDGELYQGNVLAVTTGEGMGDPAYEVEQKEMRESFLKETFEAAFKLPTCQRQALLYALKLRLDDVLPLAETLKQHAIDLEEINGPNSKEEQQRLSASLAIARKKLQPVKSKYVSP